MKKLSDLFAKEPIQNNLEISAFIISGRDDDVAPKSLLFTLHIRDLKENSLCEDERIDLVFKKYRNKLLRYINNVVDYLSIENSSFSNVYFMYCSIPSNKIDKLSVFEFFDKSIIKPEIAILKKNSTTREYSVTGSKNNFEFIPYFTRIKINYCEAIKSIRKQNKIFREEIINRTEQQKLYAQSLVELYLKNSDVANISLNNREDVVSFLLSILPDARIIKAANELRSQYAAENIESKPKYADRQSPIEPIDFLLEHYGNEIRDGNLGAGTLQGYDRALYSALERRLAKLDYKPTVQQYIDSFKAEEKIGSPTQRRFAALAEILDTSREEAASFFSSIRPDRLPPEIGESLPPRPGRSR